MFMFESQLVQMPDPRDITLYWPGPRAFSVVQKPRGWAHISAQKPRGARGGMVTGQIDTCITLTAPLAVPAPRQLRVNYIGISLQFTASRDR